MQPHAIIPALNELSSFNGVKSYLETCCDEMELLLNQGTLSGITFIDDGSTDGSFEYLSNRFANYNNVIILRQSERMGKTKAMLNGIRSVQKAEAFLTCDADMSGITSALSDYMLSYLRPEIDMVVGRYDQIKFICPCETSGLRIIRASALKGLITSGSEEYNRFLPVLEYQDPRDGFYWEFILNQLILNRVDINWLTQFYPVKSRIPGGGSTSYEEIVGACVKGNRLMWIYHRK